jgi:hypothetical protein
MSPASSPTLRPPSVAPNDELGPLEIHRGIKRDYPFRGIIDLASIGSCLRDLISSSVGQALALVIHEAA